MKRDAKKSSAGRTVGKEKRKNPLLASLRRLGRYLLVVLLAYLLQVTAMPYFRLGGVTPSLCIAVIGIMTVGFGRLRAYWTGAIFGILSETMMSSLTMLNLILYPASAIFCSIFFADRSERRLEELRSTNPGAHNGSVYLRTVGCTMLNVVIYETVNIAYMYLRGSVPSLAQIGRSVINLFASALLAAALMLPLRRFLGLKRKAEPAPRELGRYIPQA